MSRHDPYSPWPSRAGRSLAQVNVRTGPFAVQLCINCGSAGHTAIVLLLTPEAPGAHAYLGRDRGRQPARLGSAELRDEVVARLLDELSRPVEIGLEPEIVLEDPPVDHHRPDVRDVGRADDRPDGVDDRCDIDRLRVDDDEV